MRKFRFCINWKLTLFTAFFLPLLLGLGTWQLERANQKATILENWASQQAKAPLAPKNLNATLLDAEPSVKFEGRFDDQRYWLQEGQILNGRPGYLVLMRAESTDGQDILVNRGWVEANPDRAVLPIVPSSRGLMQLEGRARVPSAAPMTNEKSNPLRNWPHRILEIELQLMNEQANANFLPFVVDLSADHPNAFQVIERKLNMSPEKHRAYAIQWFTMALTLVILWCLTNTNLFSLIKKEKQALQEK